MAHFYQPPNSALSARKIMEYKRDFIGRWLIGLDKKARVLDLGCGYGLFLRACAEMGFTDLTGVEQEEDIANQARKTCPIAKIISDDLGDFIQKKSEDSYDVIIALNVIEHLKREVVSEILNRIGKLLTPNGFFIIETPNGDSLLGLHTLYSDITHQGAFTKQLLVQLLSQAGFKEVSVYPRFINSNPFIRFGQKILAKIVGLDDKLMFSGNLVAISKKTMNPIAINLLWISHLDQTGSFVFVKNLLDQLFKLDSQTSFLLITRWRDRHFFKQRYRQHPNVKIYVSDPRLDLIRQPILAGKKIWAKWRENEPEKERLIAQELNDLIRQRKIKKMFFPVQIIYPHGLEGIRHYVTILDLQHEYLPENFSAKELTNRRENLAYIANTAHHLFAISEYTKQTLLDKLNLPAEMITVTPLAPDNLKVEPEPIAIPKPFLFFPAALWPHKNHWLLIEVLHRLSSSHPDLHLVFSGVIKKKKLKTELDNRLTEYHLTDRVHFLGFVSDQVITWLYQNAALLVFPSSFEGFGMPILESFRHRLPVVAARNSSIVEVAGDAAILCETNNVSEFAIAIDKLLSDEKIKKELRSKMESQLKKFSWVQVAKETLNRLTD